MTTEINEVTPNEITDAKKEIINKSLGIEGVNLDNVSDEDLDKLLASVSSEENITEKVDTIIRYFNNEDESKIIESISKYIGVHLNEAKSIYQLEIESQPLGYFE